MEGTPRLTRLLEAEGAPETLDRRSLTEAKRSFDQINTLLYQALRPTRVEASSVDGPYIREVYDDHLIVSEGAKLFRRTYSIDGEGNVKLGDPETVVEKRTYERVTESAVVLSEGEAKGKGNVFDVLVIQPGTSKNGRRYRREVLEESTPRLDGARSFASDGPDHDPRKRGVKALVGWFSDARYERKVELPNGQIAEGVVAAYHVTDKGLAETLRESLDGGNPTLITFSIVADGEVQRVREGARTVVDVTRINSYESVDPVINAAAGGMAVRLVASVEDPSVNWEALTLAEAVKGLAKGEIVLDDLKAHRADLAEAIDGGKIAVATDPAPATPAPAAPARVAESTDEDEEGKTKALVEAALAPFQTERLVESALSGHSKLPERVKARIREATSARVASLGRALTGEEIAETVKREVDYLAALNPAVVTDSGASVTDMKSEKERVTEAVYDILAGTSNDSIKAMYVDLTGDRQFTGRLQEGARLTESIDSTTFAQIMGDSITRRMLDVYRLPDLNDWRQIVNVVPVTDFRTQRRTRMGGYGNLPAVAQGAAYGALTSPGDEEATYAPSKRGGTEDLTLETIANDDLGAMRQIPVRLARAAAQTLHEFAFDFLKDNAVIYDALALFHASHGGNLGASALSASTLIAGRTAMLKQTDMSNSKRLAIRPKHLIVPIDLEQTAVELTQTTLEVGSNNNTINFIRRLQLNVIVVDYWTDANNWFLVADKALVPTIELGFFNGREEPELFLQDAPTVGSVFSNDKLTYKIRHIYGGAVMDYRGFYGAVVA